MQVSNENPVFVNKVGPRHLDGHGNNFGQGVINMMTNYGHEQDSEQVVKAQQQRIGKDVLMKLGVFVDAKSPVAVKHKIVTNRQPISDAGGDC